MHTERPSLGFFLIQFRKKVNLTIEDVALICGVSEKKIRQWEHNKTKPSDYEAGLLAHLYKMPLIFFSRNYEENPFNVSARMNIADNGCFNRLSDIDKSYFSNQVDSFYTFVQEVLPHLESIDDGDNKNYLPIFNHDNHNRVSLNMDTLPDYTSYIRDRFLGIKNGPIGEDPLKTLISKFEYVSFCDMPKNIHGLAFYTKEDFKSFIYINNNDSYVKQVFTFMHELGHIVFHSNRSATSPEDEEFANYFANLMLLPPSDMRAIFNNVTKNNFQIDSWIDKFKEISNDYFVSYKTILHSLYHLDIIEESEIQEYAVYIIDKLKMGHSYNQSKGLEFNYIWNDIVTETIYRGYIARDRALMLMSNDIRFS